MSLARTWTRPQPLLRAVIGALACLASAGDASGKPAPAAGNARAAVAELEATYRPLALRGALDRTRRACAAGPRLRAAAAALPRVVPAGAAVDDDAWRAAVSGLGLAVENLIAACRSPDLKVHHISGNVESADDCLAAVDDEVGIVLDQARLRDLPPSMKRFQAALQPLLRPRGKPTCKQVAELARLASGLADSPPRTDAQRWDQARGVMISSLDQLKASRCGPRGSEAEATDALTHVHDGFYQLVLLLPPRDG
jgi:hypothetical protein